MTPTSLITRATLDGVAQIYKTNVLPTDPDTCVLWDCLQVAGCEVLTPEVRRLEQGSVLHRWIVLDAIESAESVPQETFGKAAIAAARAWIADPSEENRAAAYNAADSSAAYYAAYAAAAAASASSFPDAASYASYASASAAAAAASSSPDAASYASYASASAAAASSHYASANAAYYASANAAYYAAASSSASSSARAAASVNARLRFRVLATMAQAGVLPNPSRRTGYSIQVPPNMLTLDP